MSVRPLLALLLPAAALLLAACSRPTDVETTWHAQRGSAGPFSQLLVVGVSEDLARRAKFEDLLVDRLRGSNNMAWASSRQMRPDTPLNRDTVTTVVRRTGADAVVVTRLVNQDVSVDEVGARTGVKTQRRSESPVDFFRYDYNEYEEPGYLVVKSTVHVATDVYDAGDGRLLYSIDTVTYEKETEAEILQEVTQAIARQLRRDGLVN